MRANIDRLEQIVFVCADTGSFYRARPAPAADVPVKVTWRDGETQHYAGIGTAGSVDEARALAVAHGHEPAAVMIDYDLAQDAIIVHVGQL